MKQVIIDIGPDGEVRIDAVGFKGKACEKATAAFEEALGKVSKRTKKSEWYQSTASTVKQMGV